MFQLPSCVAIGKQVNMVRSTEHYEAKRLKLHSFKTL